MLLAAVREAAAELATRTKLPPERLVLGGRPVEIVGLANDVQQFTSGFSVEGIKPGPVHASPTIYVPSAQASSGLFASCCTAALFPLSLIMRTEIFSEPGLVTSRGNKLRRSPSMVSSFHFAS